MKKLSIIIYAAVLLTGCKDNSSDSYSTSDFSTSPVGLDKFEPDSVTVADIAPYDNKLPISITILYGTNRMIVDKNNTSFIQFGNQPSNPRSSEYTVGTTVVSIPPNHEEGRIETPSIWKLEFHEDTLKHMVERVIKKLSDQEFNALLKQAPNGKDAFIFVHGFNNSFKDAALRTAQLAQDIHLPITPIMFSWSSKGGVANYSADEDQVQLAIPAFENFIKRVARNGNFKNIHLIAHSMGNRLLMFVMKQLQYDTTNLKIDQIIMAAPDVFANVFEINFAEALLSKCKHVTIYTAKNDWALAASKKIHHNLRLGELGVPPPAIVLKNIDIIDAVNEKTDFLGHDRFARSPKIIADIDSILKTGLSAAQRNIPNKKFGNYLYYYFK